MTINQQSHAQMEGLATLLVLGDETRKLTTLREFGFFTIRQFLKAVSEIA